MPAAHVRRAPAARTPSAPCRAASAERASIVRTGLPLALHGGHVARTLATPSSARTRRSSRSGAALVEFAFIALAFYLLLAGTIEVGRMVFAMQTLQNAARVGARELAQAELPATYTFEQALADPQVRETIFDPGLLVLDVSAMDDVEFQHTIDGWPAINRMLIPLMLREKIDIGAGEKDYFHFPGAILQVTNPGPFDPPYIVVIPRVKSRDAEGHETIDFVPVVEEVRPSTDPAEAPFSMVSTGREKGLVCLRVNYPFQAATLSAYRVESGPSGPINTPIQADDSAVTLAAAPPGTPAVTGSGGATTYSGPYGLGVQYALGEQVRPFRRLLSAQSMFRREVFSR
jgi:hypothetical protein